jgi:ElaB/YqjD/DUF883 family membrane-anchored ribosome-binding protein
LPECLNPSIFDMKETFMTQVSPSSSIGYARYGDLLCAIQGLRNWRAVLLSILFLGAALLLVFLGGVLGFSAFFALLAMAVAYCGISATGLLLMDQAQELPPRPLLLAVAESAPAALRILAVALIAFVIVLLLYALMAIILLVCKIPGIGPVLYAVAFPVLVVASGFLMFGIAVTFSMICPAIWSGASIQGAMAMLWQIAAKRAVELLINLILLYLLSLVVMVITLGGILGTGFVSVAGLSTGILGVGVSPNPFGMSILSSMDGGHLASYAKAAAFGSGILFVLVFSALNAMLLSGLNRIYLKLSADLDPSATEQLISQRLAEAREKAQAIKEESQRRLEEAREHRHQQQEATARTQTETTATAETQANDTPVAGTQESAASLCPQCQTPTMPGDLFCGACGSKLR